MFIPLALLMMTGLWVDGINAGITVAKSDIVNLMLITLLVMAGAFPIMWGSFRTWRQAVRAEADMKVRPTGT